VSASGSDGAAPDASTSALPGLDVVTQYFGSQHPLFRAMGIRILGVTDSGAQLAMPCMPRMCDARGAVHRGAMVMLDNTCGLAIFAAIGRVTPVATIDLRVDYLREIPPATGIRCTVTCIRHTPGVAWIRGDAVTDDDAAQLLATVTGTFAINTMGPPLEGMLAAARKETT
jgi:uncharacterized protein (TIGR00369 family)